MDNFIKEGEQMMDGSNNSNNNSNQNSGNQGNDNYDNQSNQNSNQSQGYNQQSGGNNNNNNNNNNNQQQGSGGGGGFLSKMEGNTEDAYVNNEANAFLTKEGLPSSMDGAVDGVIDTEFNKYK